MAFILLRRLPKQIITPIRWISEGQRLMAKEDIPDEMDILTGVNKREVLSYVEGNCDPFNVMPRKRGPGTKDNPNLIPSAFEGRIVGCLCCDNRFPNWMWLEKGCPKRCECGYWFKLTEVKSFCD